MDKYHFVIEFIVQNLAALNLKVTMVLVVVAAFNRVQQLFIGTMQKADCNKI